MARSGFSRSMTALSSAAADIGSRGPAWLTHTAFVAPMPIVGGMGTMTGPVVGALLFSYLQIKLLASPVLRDSYLFIYGGLLIVVMLFEPKGIVGLWERLIALRPRRQAPPPVGEVRRAS